ncbi:MAG: RIP metalloprotease RseP [Bacteroidales bacterium]|nr:RIP metalloprotease RseP [Bacteroidales bacterium]MCM1146924.1 RIP metalloprotease RseP [Bacteroidales bacterium]MCM1205578.1 RIP metalloprotease RseP [Bacillota bacterium]MCM1510311.1 RIP metalloprotease RseP [Clostridium sp.]
METFWIKTLQFLLAITILVALHEGGHFFFAKLFKTRVSRFYIFANFKFHIWSSYDNWWRKLTGKPLITERGEDGNKRYNEEAGTEYGLGWLPIGGYCQIDGMVDETQSAEDLAKKPVQPWEFRSKKAYQRLLIMAGGVMVNFFLALIIYSAVFYTWGEDYVALKDMKNGMKFNSSAKNLGFRDGDILLGTDKGEFREFSTDMFRDLATAREAYVMRDGKKSVVALPGELDLLAMLKSDPVFVRPLVPCDIDSVLAGTPASEAGIRKGDKILSVNGKSVDSWNDYKYQVGILEDRMTAAKTAKDSLAIRTVKLVVARNASSVVYPSALSGCPPASAVKDTMTVVMSPELKLGLIESSIYSYYKPTHLSYGILESVPAGISYGISVLEGYVGDLKYLFSADGAKSLGGFGAIGSMFPPVWDWSMFWRMTAFLSIILAFMNIIPIPGLDGGHILILLMEVVTGKTPSLRFQQIAQNIGMGLLLLLMLVANLNDVLRWIGLM